MCSAASRRRARWQASTCRTRRRLPSIGRGSKPPSRKRTGGGQRQRTLPLTSGNQPVLRTGSSKNLVAEPTAEGIVPAVPSPVAIAGTEVAATRVSRLLVISVVVRVPIIVGARRGHATRRNARRRRNGDRGGGAGRDTRGCCDDARPAPIPAQRDRLGRRHKHLSIAAVGGDTPRLRLRRGQQTETGRYNDGDNDSRQDLHLGTPLGNIQSSHPGLPEAARLTEWRLATPSIAKVNALKFRQEKALKQS